MKLSDDCEKAIMIANATENKQQGMNKNENDENGVQ